MKERLKGFLSGVLVTAILTGTIGTAAATIGPRTVQANYNDIKITMNGEKITPKDATGTIVEPFAVNGTTYLPVRAISNALGISVDWNADTNTVVLNGNTLMDKAVIDELTLFHDLFRLADCFDDLAHDVKTLQEMAVARDSGYITTSQFNDMSENVTKNFDECNAFAEEMIDLCKNDESLNIMSDIIDAQGCLVRARNSILSASGGQIPSEYYTFILDADTFIITAKNNSQKYYSKLYQSII